LSVGGAAATVATVFRGLRTYATLAVAALSCSCQPKTTASSPAVLTKAVDPNAAFRKLTDRWLNAYEARRPAGAVERGVHEQDGKLRDVTDAGLNAEVKALKEALAEFSAVDPATLDTMLKVERGAIVQTIRADLFELEQLRRPWTDPMFYLGGLALTPYISRDYAPLADRAAGIIGIGNATPEYLGRAEARLEHKLPKTFVDTALLQVRGTLAFIDKDVPAAMKGLDTKTAGELSAALAAMQEGLKHYESFLVARRETATNEFALGPERFAEMLRETQGFDVDLERLESLARADLARNLAALTAACAKIDPKRSVAQVVDWVARDKPSNILSAANAQAEQMRDFVVRNKLLTIPTEDIAEVRESPPFMRWNAAFLSPAGVFEKAALPSFYYISPPDPAWPAKQQRAYIPGKTDLLFITIHEVWPGHFLHGLHIKTSSSRVLKSSWNYAMGEGWAHYAEEMMWDAGISEDPAVHVGQLQNALLRDIRFLSALGLHTGGMTVSESTKLFQTKAFQDPANARQQAVRGTFDPMYLSYTLGKLAILKLRDDVQAQWAEQNKAFSPKAFHDALLSYGAAPLPVIREAMLGPDAGPLL